MKVFFNIDRTGNTQRICAWRDWSRNIKWPSIQRWKCLIWNGNLETLKLWNIYLLKFWKLPSVFWFEKCLLLWVTFTEKPQMKINSLKKQQHWYLFHTWSDKAFQGTVVNRVLPSLHVAGHLKSRLQSLYRHFRYYYAVIIFLQVKTFLLLFP